MSARVEVDDLWLASYLVAEGATLKAITVMPSSYRLTAVFEIEGASEEAITAYARGNPYVRIHDLRTALNQLRDAMHRELSARNGKPQIKEMPNGKNSPGKRRLEENEDTARNHRLDQGKL